MTLALDAFEIIERVVDALALLFLSFLWAKIFLEITKQQNKYVFHICKSNFSTETPTCDLSYDESNTDLCGDSKQPFGT